MAANRKLQSVVDATLKKIDEGLVEFASAYKKAEEAANPNQREKTQAELKREIKKLQRFREDVMKWLTEGEIKDKQPLLEARKRIEGDMERFKTFEREAKTKPFSFQGLAMSEKADPDELRRLTMREKVEMLVSDLKLKIEALEADIEALLGKKKKPTGVDATKLDELKLFLTRHSFHALNLELFLRKIDNECTIDFDEADAVLDQVSMFITDFESPDYFHDETLYEILALNDLTVDASYFQLVAAVDQESDAESQGTKKNEQAQVKAEIKVPLSAMAKAKAFKKALDQVDGAPVDVIPPAPVYSPPAPPRPAMPTTAPPAVPAVNPMPTRQCPRPPTAPSAPSAPVLSPPPAQATARSPVPPAPAGGVWGGRSEQNAALSSASSSPVRPDVEDTIVRHRGYTAVQPARLPDFPTTVLGGTGCEETVVRKLSEEALLFVFYYREGSFLQLVIARELRRRGFKWHRKNRQWYKRAEDPKMTTVDYEQGSFLTLDPRDADWRLKVKHDFILEYQFTNPDELALD
jgi:CCR4-NOT transcription complex subunit 3